MDSRSNDDVVPFRVALMLKRYKFGSNTVARYLGKSRGLVQSWMQAGESHALAERQFKIAAFERKLKTVRRNITKENIYYLLTMKLIDLDLPPEYIGKHMGVPTSTIRTWKEGVSPKGVKKLFIDRDYLDKEFRNVMDFLSERSTRENKFYYLAIKLSKTARQKVGRRRIGGKTISNILVNHYNLIRTIPKETITCWINGRRVPKNAFAVLKNDDIIEEEYRNIVEDLTQKHMDYHIAKALHDRYNWKYSKISKTLGLDKEKVRGWVKKDRGNPEAKCFKNPSLIEDELKRYVEVAPNGGDVIEHHVEDMGVPAAYESDFDEELEDEILYHLSYFPQGLSSPLAIKTILIDNKDAELNEILFILNNSPRIIRKGKRWVLRQENGEF
jgi:DNA-binding transcriptional regulator YiaG